MLAITRMLTPDYKTFLQLSRDATLIPVAKTLSADLLTPVGAFLSVAAKQKYAFLLESVEGGEKIGRYTFLGAQPRMVITARGTRPEITRGNSSERRTGSVVDVLRATLQQHRPATVAGPAAVHLRRRGIFRLRHGAAVRAPAQAPPRTI